MRNRIFVRPTRTEETQQFLDWSLANRDKSEFDPEVPAFPTTVTWTAYDRSGALGYLPVQTPFMLESFAPRPGLSEQDTARCLRELVEAQVTQAQIRGIGEIYFLGSAESTNALAANQVFEELPFRVFRLKVKDTER